MRTELTAAKLLTPFSEIETPCVTIQDGRVAAIESCGALKAHGEAQHIDFPGATLAPAWLDIHTHGAMGHDVMEGSDEAFDVIGKFLGKRGVGAYLPTTVTASIDQILRALEGVARQIERSENSAGGRWGAKPVGIHLEGPFLSHSKRGVHPPEYLKNPSTELLRRFWEAASGRILLMTIAPELPGACDFIREAVRLGIRVSLGHSNAGTQEALAGIAAGATSATHTFNAMRALDHREPGLLAVVLDQQDLFAELICDGIHVDPMVVRLFYRAKRPDRGILITDAMAATGMPDGVYQLGGMDVTLTDGKCLREGNLAGSALTMDRAVRNFVEFTGAPRSVAIRFAATNPARLVGLADVYGELAPGRPANIAVLSPEGAVLRTLLRGEFCPA